MISASSPDTSAAGSLSLFSRIVFSVAFRGLALRTVEVGGDGNDGLGDLVAEIRLRGFFQLQEDVGAHFGRRDHLASDQERRVAVWSARDFEGHALRLAFHLFEPPS